MKHIVFILNVPAFYKINLLKCLADYYKITAVILGTTNQVVSSEFLSSLGFNTIILSHDDMDVKSKGIIRAFKLWKILNRLKYDYIVYSGWDNIDLIVNSFLTKFSKNCVISESSIYESSTSGWKAFLKKIILRRFNAVLASGVPHVELLRKLGYKGKIVITGSVGVNSPFQRKKHNNASHEKKYIYIGRLIEIKNLRLLIDVFNTLRKPLTIVGEGALELHLKGIASPNISFLGFASRKTVNKLLCEHDCLILPSLKEPWGLVVEEALQCGLPVIASNRVGSSIDLIGKYDSGLIFDPYSKSSLIESIHQYESNDSYYQNNVLKIDFEARKNTYIEAFKNLFEGDN